ncbi:MAG: hypothetical protein ABW005_14485 [Burkholderiaceae bacterium]
MKNLLKLALALGVLMLGALLIGGWALWSELAGSAGPHVHLSVNGEDIALTRMDFGDGFGAGLGLLIAGLVLLVVLPLALLLGLGLPLLILGLVLGAVLLAMLSVGALLFSPLLVLGLILWLLLRPRKVAAAPPPRTEPRANPEPGPR